MKIVSDGRYTFGVVDHIPYGYSIWNINMISGYLPLCKLAASQPFDGARNVDTATLKAIKCDGAEAILAAVGYGPETPEEMEAYIAAHNDYVAVRMRAALPYLRRIRRNENDY